jgi:hypothetical protein
MGDDFAQRVMSEMWHGGPLMIAAIIASYLAPTVIAVFRRAPGARSAAVLNILFGWTVLGWVVALVLALDGGADVSPAADRAGDATGPHRRGDRPRQLRIADDLPIPAASESGVISPLAPFQPIHLVRSRPAGRTISLSAATPIA